MADTWVKVSDTEVYDKFLQEIIKRGKRRVELEQLLLPMEVSENDE